MDDSKALGILRTIAPEFKAVSNDEAQQFLVLSAPPGEPEEVRGVV